MPQRLTQQRQLYYGEETTEGTEVLGVGTTAIAVTNLVTRPNLAFHPRPIVGHLGGIAGKVGAQLDPALSFTVQCRGGGTSIVPKLDPILRRVLATPQQDPGPSPNGYATIASASGTPNKVLNVDDSAGFTVGNAVAVETGSGTNIYEVGWIESKTDGSPDTITLTHNLTFNAAVGAKVRPSITYAPQDSNHGSLSFQVWLDSTNRVSFIGSKGTIKFDAPAPGIPPTMTFGFRAMSYLHAAGTRPTPTYDTATTPAGYKLKINSTVYDVKLMSWDLRQAVARKRSQNSTTGTVAQLVTDRRVLGVLQAYDIDEAQFSDWKNETEQALAHQFGSTVNNMIAYQIPRAQRRDVGYGDDNGLTTDVVAFQGNVASGADDIRLAFM